MYELSDEQENHRQILSNWDMIRERDAGYYAETLGYNPIDLAVAALAAKNSFVWYDMCCGEFCAGRDVAYATKGQAEAIGVDLDSPTAADYLLTRNAVIRRGDVVDYPVPSTVDLITCVRGLFYVERLNAGGAGRALSAWYNAMPSGARLTADIHTQMPRFKPTLSALKEAFEDRTVSQWTGIDTVLIDIIKTEDHPPKISL